MDTVSTFSDDWESRFIARVYPHDLARMIQEIDTEIFGPHNQALAPMIFDEYFPCHQIPIHHVHIDRCVTYSKGTHGPGQNELETYVVWGKEVERKAEELIAHSNIESISDADFGRILIGYALATVRYRVLCHTSLFPNAKLRTFANLFNDETIAEQYRKQLFRRRQKITFNTHEESAITTDFCILVDLIGIAMGQDGKTLRETLHFLTNT